MTHFETCLCAFLSITISDLEAFLDDAGLSAAVDVALALFEVDRSFQISPGLTLFAVAKLTNIDQLSSYASSVSASSLFSSFLANKLAISS